MGKETKIGLSVIFVLLVVFSGVLVYRLRGPATEPAVQSDAEAAAENQSDPPILASGPGKPTLLAANEKPESTPRGGSTKADAGPQFSPDRYAPRGGPTTPAAAGDHGKQHRPSFLPQEPTDASATGEDRYAKRGHHPGQPHGADENDPAGLFGQVAPAGDQQPTEAAADSPDAVVDPFSRPSTRPREAEAASTPAALLPADNVRLTPSPFPSARGDRATGNHNAGDRATGEISPTGGPGDTRYQQSGSDSAAQGADPYSPATGTPPSNIYGAGSRRSGDTYGRAAAQGGVGSRQPADEPPDARMPYRDRMTLPDSRMQSRGHIGAPDASGSARSSQQCETYTVEPNDSYWTISEKVYGTGGYFKAIQRHNQPKTGRTEGLSVGQSLSVPAADVLAQKYPELCPKPRQRPTDRGQMMTAAAGGRDRLAGGGRVYVVEEGDTLFDIARYELGKPSRWNEIYELNRDQLGQDFDYLAPGMKLVLPDGGQSDPVTSRPRNPYQR